MALLFTDTTYDINLGVLSDELEWLEFRTHKGQRASIVLQKETDELCRKLGVRPRDLQGVITCAGPGFYTGLRLSEGFADVFKLFHIPCYSFYSYEVPKWCGHESGVWMTKAYKGEYFIHQWAKDGGKNLLLAAKELPGQLEKLGHVFMHSTGAMGQEVSSFTETLDLIKESPRLIMGEVIRSKAQRESFYFRAPEDEFRVSV